jgi:large subunit ribosomal protein L18
MARGPRYRVDFRRRREGKTNYHRRLVLIRSQRNRVIIRCSLKHTTVQVAEANVNGDKILVSAVSQQLTKSYGWNYNTSNLPSAYLTGYLCGMRAKKAGIEDAILDVGILVHDNRVKAAFKGFMDAGLDVPHNDKWFGESLANRISGKHIADYAAKLSKEEPDHYKAQFSMVLKNKVDPAKIVDQFNKTKDAITKKP